MEPPTDSRIIYAERLGNGIIITFDDGKSAIYSAPLLRSFFSQARELRDEECPPTHQTELD